MKFSLFCAHRPSDILTLNGEWMTKRVALYTHVWVYVCICTQQAHMNTCLPLYLEIHDIVDCCQSPVYTGANVYMCARILAIVCVVRSCLHLVPKCISFIYLVEFALYSQLLLALFLLPQVTRFVFTLSPNEFLFIWLY